MLKPAPSEVAYSQDFEIPPGGDVIPNEHSWHKILRSRPLCSRSLKGHTSSRKGALAEHDVYNKSRKMDKNGSFGLGR